MRTGRSNLPAESQLRYVCKEAVAWWKRRLPDCPAGAVELAHSGTLATTTSITVRSVVGEPDDRIIEYAWGELPEAPFPAAAYGQDIETQEIPL